MSVLNKTVSVGCAAAAAAIGPTFIVLGIASSICNEKTKSIFDKPWVLFGTPILLGYASYALWTKE
jgi:hypothetical protein